MSRRPTPATRAKPARRRRRTGLRRHVLRVLMWGALAVAAVVVGLVALGRFVDPPTTPYIFAEGRRLGHVEMRWTPADRIAPAMLRAAVAAEDANFCNHWGFDVEAIRAAIRGGGQRGASTISQQVVKNVFLWQSRSWLRKALEAALTPVMETLWPKRRILEVYLNVAEFGEGVFGIGAAAQAAFGVTPDKLSVTQAARLAAVLPSPRTRSAATPTPFLRRRAEAIAAGARTIAADGRAACFGG